LLAGLPEFQRPVLEALRQQPLKDRVVAVARAAGALGRLASLRPRHLYLLEA
jgi:predicted ATPase with chaperone activity